MAWDMAHEVVGAAALPSFFVYVSIDTDFGSEFTIFRRH